MERKHIDATDIVYSVTGPLFSCLSPGEDEVSIAPLHQCPSQRPCKLTSVGCCFKN